MEELIKSWENLAIRYQKQAINTNGHAYEHLIASATTLEMCAEQLKLFLQNSRGK
jgi:hypothetical protein